MTAQTGEHTTHKNINIPYGFFYCLISFLPRCRWSPLFTVVRFTLPCALIVVCSGLLLLWHWKWPQSKINIPTISLLFGMLWAWHVVTKAMLLTPPHFNYLVIALLSILFIGTIAFPIISLPLPSTLYQLSLPA